MGDAVPPRVAFIGLGNMGSRMARRLVENGHRVRGFDVSEAALAEFARNGGEAAASATEAVGGASVTILMLPDSAAVESVVTDPAVLAALAPGAVVVDMSSSEPERTRALAGVLGERNVALVDAPVSGGVARAASGELTVMAGGEEADVARVQPLLDLLGRTYRAGPVGAGHAVKALNNLMSATHLLVTSEAMLAGMQFGLAPDVMLAIFNASSGRSGSTENKWPNFIVPETYNSGFSLRLMLKDLRIAVKLAEWMGSPRELSERTVELWAEASQARPPDADHTDIARWLRERTATDG